MAKCGGRGRQRMAGRHSPYSFPFYGRNIKSYSGSIDKKKWEDATCSVCMDCPHNAVLLLCSSHDNGCRPFMCDTTFHFSNCLDQYKSAHAKGATSPDECELKGLCCPLCRGEVKGWTVVEPARAYLNAKRRSCMQENCSFFGTYRELRRHVRLQHPLALPRAPDPALEHKWNLLEHERERDDVISTITSSIPGAMIFGDYVIEAPAGFNGGGSEEGEFEMGMDEAGGIFDRDLVNVVLFLSGFGQGGGGGGGRVRTRGIQERRGGSDGGGEEGRVNFQHRLVRARRGSRLMGRERG